MKKIVRDIRYNLRNMDKVLLFFTIILLIFGLLNIVTASSREAVVVNEKGIYYYFYRQMIMLTIGTIAAMIIINVRTRNYYKLGPIFYIIAFVLICLLCFVEENRGAQNWISILGIPFQPSEFAKVVIIVCLGLFLEKFNLKLSNPNINNSKLLTFMLFMCFTIPGLIVYQKDLGTATISGCISLAIILGSKMCFKNKKWIIAILAIGVLVFGGGLYAVKGYIFTDAQKARVKQFIDPCKYYESGGYQVCNAYIAFNNGGLTGLGIGKSKQKYSYIPEPHTDSIFAIIGEEYGVVWSTLFVFIPYIIILYRIMDISRKASTLRGRYICFGVAFYIFMHIFINLGGLFGVIPLTGVPLPFLSYGGTFTICLIASLGIVQRVNIETRTKKIKL